MVKLVATNLILGVVGGAILAVYLAAFVGEQIFEKIADKRGRA